MQISVATISKTITVVIVNMQNRTFRWGVCIFFCVVVRQCQRERLLCFKLPPQLNHLLAHVEAVLGQVHFRFASALPLNRNLFYRVAFAGGSHKNFCVPEPVAVFNLIQQLQGGLSFEGFETALVVA